MSVINKPSLPASLPLGKGVGVFGWLKSIQKTPAFFWGIFIFTLTVWPSAFVAIPYALQDLAPDNLITARLVITSAVFLPFLIRAWKREIRPNINRDWKKILAMGATGIAIYLMTLTYGQRTMGAGETSLILNLSPLLTGFFAAFILKEVLHQRMIVGALIALLGVVTLVVGQGQDLEFDWNAALIMGTAVSAALYYVIQKGLTRFYSATTLAGMTIVTGTLLVLPFTGGVVESFQMLSGRSLYSVLYIALVVGFVPYIGWAYVLSRMPAGKASLYLYYIPVLATLMGWLILDEQITINFIFSGALIILGVMIGTGTIMKIKLRKKTLPCQQT